MDAKYFEALKLEPLFVVEVLIEGFEVAGVKKIDESVANIAIVLS